eukprot:GILJ01025899.1.p1 GENE.GILJ01025899.1~~GILJ01025899.1.p1  ORF type:complete len:472 (+),score=54.32 GILJ01025899.1:57-1418(+)
MIERNRTPAATPRAPKPPVRTSSCSVTPAEEAQEQQADSPGSARRSARSLTMTAASTRPTSSQGSAEPVENVFRRTVKRCNSVKKLSATSSTSKVMADHRQTLACVRVAGYDVKVYETPNVAPQFRRLLAKAHLAKKARPELAVRVHILLHGLTSEQLVSTCVLAAASQVEVHVLYQTTERQESIKEMRPNLTFTRLDWGKGENEHMGIKMALVSHTVKSEQLVYLSSIDASSDVPSGLGGCTSDMGLTVHKHTGLYDTYLQYFETLVLYADNVKGFRAHMAANKLHFSDGVFTAYFFPVVKKGIWLPEKNPLALMCPSRNGGKKSEQEDTEIRMNISSFRKDTLTDAFIGKLEKRRKRALASNKIYSVYTVCNNEDGGKFPTFDSKRAAPSNLQHYTLALLSSGQYCSMASSAGLQLTDHTMKANTCLLLREKRDSHAVFDAFNDIIQRTMR